MNMELTLFAHILTGSVAVLAGSVASASKKGEKVHRLAGNVFFTTMLIMCFFGGLLAILKPMAISVVAAVTTSYFVITSWFAARNTSACLTRMDFVFPVIALSILSLSVCWGIEARTSSDGLKDGFSQEPYLFFAFVAFVALLLDLRLLVYRGVGSKHRIIRHLWRMCFAMYIAVGSLFTQGAASFPDEIRNSPLVSIPEVMVFIFAVYWVVKSLYVGRNRVLVNTDD